MFSANRPRDVHQLKGYAARDRLVLSTNASNGDYSSEEMRDGIQNKDGAKHI